MISQPLLRGKTKDTVIKCILFGLSVVALLTCVTLLQQNRQIADLRQSLSQVLAHAPVPETAVGDSRVVALSPESETEVGRTDAPEMKWVWYEKPDGSIAWLVCTTKVGVSIQAEPTICLANTNTDTTPGAKYRAGMILWERHVEENAYLQAANQAKLGWHKMCDTTRSPNSMWRKIRNGLGQSCEKDLECASSMVTYDPAAPIQTGTLQDLINARQNYIKEKSDKMMNIFTENEKLGSAKKTQEELTKEFVQQGLMMPDGTFLPPRPESLNNHNFVELMHNSFCGGANSAKFQGSPVDYKGLDQSGLGHWA